MMSDTQELLSRITEVRQRLERAQEIAHSGWKLKGDDDAALMSSLVSSLPAPPEGRVQVLEQQVVAGAESGAWLDGSIRQLTDQGGGEPPRLPRQLTNRARRLLEKGQDLLTRLRKLDTELAAQAGPEGDLFESSHPRAVWHRDTVAMVDVALRLIQAFPDAASVQLRLCQGVEATLETVGQRVEALSAALRHLREENARIHQLADLLIALEAGQPIDLKPFLVVAEALSAEAQQAAPLRFFSSLEDQNPRPQSPIPAGASRNIGPGGSDLRGVARFVACHSLTVAQVVARVVGHDPELRDRPLEAILAALLHDVGMLRVSADILAQPGPLTDDQKRVVEGHTRAGAELVGRLVLTGGFLAEAAAGHHERLDGTGYPDGLRAAQISSLTRLLAVCDVYSAMCTPRPYRPGRETRTALTDTLLLAEQGALDRYHAQLLLQLSFYPVGTFVELADGAVGMVVASNQVSPDMTTPGRPVVALLTDSQGRFLPLPRHVDLAHCQGRSIVRSLSPRERRKILGKHRLELI
jgi:HD-GYP domain-containing protein (c-di-GMP phosphodiesterase class II)